MLPLVPTACHICHDWQPEPLCAACLTRWNPPGARCVRCAIRLPATHDAAELICTDCEAHGPEFDRAFAALDYEAPWDRLIGRLKFHDATALAPQLAGMLAETWRQSAQPPTDLLLPLPISTTRLHERGYNQAWLLARALSRELGIPAHPDWLQRVQHTPRLMSLNPEARHQAIRGAFRMTLPGRAAVRGRHVALVDDVMTTGATLDEAAAALRQAGARSVSAWIVARTPRAPRLTRGSAPALASAR